MKPVNFNPGWEFRKENETGWQAVDLPHDAMLTEKRQPDCANGANTGFFPGGKYLYRKHFPAPAAWANLSVLLEFEGVYRNCQVEINGQLAGGQRYGYTPFILDIAPYLVPGAENEILVTVDNSAEPNSRWYTGSGIYNNVWLLLAGKTHIHPDGVKMVTRSISPAVVEIETSFIDGENLHPEIRAEISLDGNVVASGSGARQLLEIPDPRLWSAESPTLYTLNVMLLDGNRVVDEVSFRTGLRRIDYDAENGLRINGQVTKLRGACIHSDNGILGACSFAAAEDRKIRILKKAGFNAIRSAHNPLSRAALAACDTYGMYVMDENFDVWYIHKTKYDYALDFEEWHNHDIQAMVNKDFNHPCVIMYSIGNEVSETAQPRGVQLAREMTALLHSLDATRPVTCGINLMLNGLFSVGLGVYREKAAEKAAKSARKKSPGKPKLSGSAFINWFMNNIGVFMNNIGRMRFVDQATRDAFAVLDIAGYNYGRGRYRLEGKAYPQRVVVGSETFPPELYENWQLVKKYPYLVGDFLWVGWDYLGEGGLGAIGYQSRGGVTRAYPYLASDTGIIDFTGYLRPELFYSQAVWGILKTPYISVEPLTFAGQPRVLSMWRKSDGRASWSWAGCEGRKAEIHVYSDSHTVELLLNGTSLGQKKVKGCQASFKTIYAKGEILAVAYDTTGKETGRCRLVSAGETLQLTVTPEKTTLRADGLDLAYINIELTDTDGILEMGSDRKITVKIEGAGTLQGLGSANPYTEEVFNQESHHTFFGRAQAVIRSGRTPGQVKVTVSADGLATRVVMLTTGA